MGIIGKIRGALFGAPSFMVYTDGERTVRAERKRAVDAYYSNAYRACALAKARPLASLPVHVYERKDGVRAESDRRSARALSKLLRTRWNPLTTAQEGFRWLDMTKDLRGNAFARVEWRDGVPSAIWPMSGAPEVELTEDGAPLFRYAGDKFTPSGVYLQREIVWVKSPVLDDDGLFGVSLAELAAKELGLSIDIEEFYSRVINNGSHFPRWLESDSKLNADTIEQIKSQVSDGQGVVSAGKMRIFDQGLHVKTDSSSMVDMSLVEQEKWVLQQTCRTLSVPPQEVFDLSHSTYSNIEQGALNFANKTLVPECAEIERALSSVLWSVGLSDCYVQFDMNGLLRGNYRDRMEGYRIGIYSQFLCPNDVRAKEDMPPYEGGDKFLRPLSYAVVDPETGEAEYPRATGGGTGQGGSGEGAAPDGAPSEALEAIHKDMRNRVRARLSETGDTEKFREFATRVLAPYANACTIARVEYDIEKDIEELVSDEGH